MYFEQSITNTENVLSLANSNVGFYLININVLWVLHFKILKEGVSKGRCLEKQSWTD